MQLTGNEDLRVIKTIEGIKSAFEALICEKDYEKINVKELCERARINKKTFYHYYETLDYLLAEMQAELSSEYLKIIRDYEIPKDLEKINREFFVYSAAQSLAYEKITVSGSYDHIRGEMISKVNSETWNKSEKFNKLSPLQQNVVLHFMHSISVGIYKLWVNEGKITPLEDVIALSNALMKEGIKAVLK